jgi:tetratricopeptide (TPR) repeat protein
LADRPPRTLLEQRIRQRCLTYEEFVQYAETFAREHREPGTLSLRHLQRLASGQHLGPLRPATARLLEHLLGEPIAVLLAPPNTPTAGEAEDRTAELYCELLRLLSMAGVLVTMPSADEQRDQLNYPSLTSGRSDNVAVDDYTALNEHLWRAFVPAMSKGAILPLVRDQFDVLVSCLNRSEGISTHRQLCSLVSELLQLAGEVYFDANKYGDAAYCYTLAAAASKEADAFDLWACAMTRHAFIEIYERRFDKAVPMLGLAARLARRGDGALSTRYWVSSVQAQVFAGLGELAACKRALDAAEKVCELSGGASNGGWLRFDGSRLAEERGACYVQLRRPDLAENALRGALRQDLSARRRASVLVDLATVGLQRNDVNQLISHAETALEIATRTGSGFIGRKLNELHGHLAPLLANNQVRQLDQRIMAVSGNFQPR